MNTISALDLFNIKKSILKRIDKEIMNHGEESAYIAYKILSALKYKDEDIYYISLLAGIHDIGAYKSEDISAVKKFEINETLIHSVYGYCILDQYDKLKDMAPMILYHHQNYKDKNKILNIDIPKESFLIGLSDRMSILFNNLHYDVDNIKKAIKHLNKDEYEQEYFNTFIELVENHRLVEQICGGDYELKMQSIYKSRQLSFEEIKSYLVYVPISIDFFSYETSIHTVSVGCCSEQICKLLDISKEYKNKIEVGAYLHDIGKVCVPIELIEKTDKLTTEEYEIIKKHVVYTEDILRDAGIDKEIIDLACNHHEKLDGSGYPKQITYKDLSIGDRIIAISDIFCALTEKRHYKKELEKDTVIQIMTKMADNNYIDKEILGLVIENYNIILESVNIKKYDYINIINEMNNKFIDIRQRIIN